MPPFDLLMAAILAILVTTISKIPNPSVKAFFYSFPIPFTLAFLVSGMPLHSGHVLGALLNHVFVWTVWWAHKKRGLPILAADAIGAVLYLLLTIGLGRVLPVDSNLLFAILIGLAVGISFAIQRLPVREEPSWTSPMPVPLKLVMVFVLAIGLYALKNHLQDAMVPFPYLGVFTMVECRHSLYTIGRRFGYLSLGFFTLMVVVRVCQDHYPVWVSLALGWIPCLILLLLFQMWATKFGRQVEAGSASAP